MEGTLPRLPPAAGVGARMSPLRLARMAAVSETSLVLPTATGTGASVVCSCGLLLSRRTPGWAEGESPGAWKLPKESNACSGGCCTADAGAPAGCRKAPWLGSRSARENPGQGCSQPAPPPPRGVASAAAMPAAALSSASIRLMPALRGAARAPGGLSSWIRLGGALAGAGGYWTWRPGDLGGGARRGMGEPSGRLPRSRCLGLEGVLFPALVGVPSAALLPGEAARSALLSTLSPAVSSTPGADTSAASCRMRLLRSIASRTVSASLPLLYIASSSPSQSWQSASVSTARSLSWLHFGGSVLMSVMMLSMSCSSSSRGCSSAMIRSATFMSTESSDAESSTSSILPTKLSGISEAKSVRNHAEA
mmetsp:Transcript_43228/g.112032  ORF Transcript_43228/g.112032 Transcript_43228/m.112032 type:complete len:365 (+) Transcript_43228:835-1929(+)